MELHMTTGGEVEAAGIYSKCYGLRHNIHVLSILWGMLLKTWGLISIFKATTLHNALKTVHMHSLILCLHVFLFVSFHFKDAAACCLCCQSLSQSNLLDVLFWKCCCRLRIFKMK